MTKSRYFPAAFAVILTFLISLVGTMLGPSWHAKPLQDSGREIPKVVSTLPLSPSTKVGTYSITQTVHSVRVPSGERFNVLVSRPVGVSEPVPAIMFLHGMGTRTHRNFKENAIDLASAGIVTLVPDKDPASQNMAYRDYERDAAFYYEFLKFAHTLDFVDPNWVGVYGESEGAYVAPILTADYDGVAFVMLVSAPGVTPRQQVAYAVENYLRNTGVPEQLYRLIGRGLGAEIPFGLINYIDFDPSPYQQRIRQPILVVYGTGDASMPIVQGAQRIVDDALVAGNRNVTVLYYKDANHGIRVGPIHGPLVEGYMNDIVRWVTALKAAPVGGPIFAGSAPPQRLLAEPLPSVRGFLSGDALVVTHVVVGSVLILGVLLITGWWACVAILGWWKRREQRDADEDETPLGEAEDEPIIDDEIPGEIDSEGEEAPPVKLKRWRGLVVLGAITAVAAWLAFLLYVQHTALLAMTYMTNPLWTFGFFTVQQVIALAAALLSGIGAARLLRVQYARRRARALSMPSEDQEEGETETPQIHIVDPALASGGWTGWVAIAGTVCTLILLSYWSGFPNLLGSYGL